jgi:hypothetical protein
MTARRAGTQRASCAHLGRLQPSAVAEIAMPCTRERLSYVPSRPPLLLLSPLVLLLLLQVPGSDRD